MLWYWLRRTDLPQAPEATSSSYWRLYCAISTSQLISSMGWPVLTSTFCFLFQWIRLPFALAPCFKLSDCAAGYNGPQSPIIEMKMWSSLSIFGLRFLTSRIHLDKSRMLLTSSMLYPLSEPARICFVCSA